ncbi:hypothetical protein [Xanthomonas vesicatoria]|uniref:hypothetical protein n=2 Tax=Xanthomonas vesicatoria TaxID=56460 RepID=UPI001E5A615E|nr:hypothetical protein [Xanthomonas vesicatoria]
MMKTALFFGSIIALGGLSGVGAVAGPTDHATKEKPKAWTANEVHAAYDSGKQISVVDVNDRFLIKSSATTNGGKVQFGFLDGARELIGTCEASKKLKSGDRRTTWLHVTYSNQDAQGNRQFEIKRTLDFDGHARIYRFSAGDGTLAALEPGIRVGLSHGTLVYEQATGPIGASGDTNGVRVSYQLTDKFSQIASSVEMDRNRWVVTTNQANPSTAPIYSVNTTAVMAHVPGSKGAAQDHAIVANPTYGNGIGARSDAVALKVSSGKQYKGLHDLQVESVVREQTLCNALPCSFDFQCNGTSTSCQCFEMTQGPILGTCLV